MIIPVIQCDICKHPIDKWEFWTDAITIKRKLRVYCHGAQEDYELDKIISDDENIITDAIAFKR